MTKRERTLGLLLLLLIAAGLLFYLQQTTSDQGLSSSQAAVSHQASQQFLGEIAKFREAEQIVEPVGRCLAYPDLAEFKWDQKLVTRLCRLLGRRMISWSEIGAALDGHHPDVLDHAFDEYAAKSFSDPDHGFLTWTFFWMFQGGSDKIEAMTQKWVEQSPKDAYALVARGLHFAAAAYTARGTAFAREVPPENFVRMREFIQKARTDLEASLAINPRLIPAYHGLLSIARLTSDQELVESSVENALAIDPADPWIYSDWVDDADPRWGGSLEELRLISEKAASHKDAEPLLELNQAAPYCAVAREYECASCGRPPDNAAALVALRRAAASGPAACFLDRAGAVATYLHDYENATRYYSQSIRFGGQVYAWRASALRNLGQNEQALADLDKAMEIGPRNVEALYVRAGVLIDMARYADAENAYLSILAIDPAHENAAVGLSMLYLSKLPKPDKAEELVSKLLEDYPKHARPWLLKAATAHGKDDRICRDALEKYLQLVDRNDPYEKTDIERAQKRLAELKR